MKKQTEDDKAINDALSLLNRIGAMHDEELLSLVPMATKQTISRMERTAYVRRDKDTKRIEITRPGQVRIGVNIDRSMVRARTVDIPKTDEDYYKGQELKAYEGRPGAMDAFALPSRFFNELRYPDGRIETVTHAA